MIGCVGRVETSRGHVARTVRNRRREFPLRADVDQYELAARVDRREYVRVVNVVQSVVQRRRAPAESGRPWHSGSGWRRAHA